MSVQKGSPCSRTCLSRSSPSADSDGTPRPTDSLTPGAVNRKETVDTKRRPASTPPMIEGFADGGLDRDQHRNRQLEDVYGTTRRAIALHGVNVDTVFDAISLLSNNRRPVADINISNRSDYWLSIQNCDREGVTSCGHIKHLSTKRSYRAGPHMDCLKERSQIWMRNHLSLAPQRKIHRGGRTSRPRTTHVERTSYTKLINLIICPLHTSHCMLPDHNGPARIFMSRCSHNGTSR